MTTSNSIPVASQFFCCVSISIPRGGAMAMSRGGEREKRKAGKWESVKHFVQRQMDCLPNGALRRVGFFAVTARRIFSFSISALIPRRLHRGKLQPGGDLAGALRGDVSPATLICLALLTFVVFALLGAAKIVPTVPQFRAGVALRDGSDGNNGRNGK